MAYRESAREAPKGSFWYGPFPFTGQAAGTIAAFLVLASLALSVLVQQQTLDCDRETGLCVYQSTNLVGERRSTSFPIANVSEVRYVQGTGKSRSSGEAMIVFRSGGDFRLPSEPEAEAKAQKERVQSYFARADVHQLHEEHTPGTVVTLFIVVLALFSGVFVYASLEKILPFRVCVFRDRVWIPRTKHSFDVNAATKVSIVMHPDHDKLRRVAVLSGEGVHFLVIEGRGGTSVHQRAARRLGELLELPVDLGPDPPTG